MKMRNLPGTDIAVSEICFGTMNFGAPVGEADAVQLIHYARDKGINFIDTANMYEGYNRYAGSHGGVAEKFIAKAVAGSRGDYVIATKFGMKVGDAPEDEGCSPAALTKQLDRSLRYLGTDYIDLYYAHRFDPGTDPAELAAAMQKAIDAGKVRCWAVSNYTGEQLSALLSAADAAGAARPVACQPALSLLKQDALDDVMAVCAREGLAVVPYQILQGGLLTGKYRRGAGAPDGSRAAESAWLAAPDDATFDKLEGIAADADRAGISMTAYAIRWALERPAVISALIGFKTTRQIDDSVAALPHI